MNHCSSPWSKLSPKTALCRGREAAQDGSTLLPWALPCCNTVPSACIPCPVTALGHCPWPSWLQLERSVAVGSSKLSVSLSDTTPPVPHAGLSSVRCQRSLRLRASLSLALPSQHLRFHRSRVKQSQIHAGSGTDQLGMPVRPVRQPVSSLPSRWLSLRFVALLLSCCYCHPPHTPPCHTPSTQTFTEHFT